MDLITGATGFVGMNLAEELGRRGKIRCLARKPGAQADFLQKLNAEIVFGSLENPESLELATRGIGTVFHLAASLDANNREELEKVNKTGTENLVRACRKNGVKKIIFLSTYLADEKYRSFYGKTKREAEKIVEKSGIPYAILRASVVYGPHDRKNFSTIINLVRASAVVPVIGKIKFQPVYARDLVGALIAAQSKKAEGKRYSIAGDEIFNFGEIISEIEKALGVKRIKVPLPFGIVKFLAALYGKIPGARLISADQMHDLAMLERIGCSDAKKDLGFRPVTFKEGIKEAVNFS